MNSPGERSFGPADQGRRMMLERFDRARGREGYLSFGIDEYWIVDGLKNQMTVLTRWRGQWQQKVLRPTQKHPTRHLPGFLVDLKRVWGLDIRR